MEFRVKDTGTVIHESELGTIFPNVTGIGAQTCSDFGLDPVFPGNFPAAGKYQKIKRNGIQNVLGTWYERYDLIDPTPEDFHNFKTQALSEVDARHANVMLTMTEHPTQVEIATWPGKVLLAEAILSGAELSVSQQAFMQANGITDENKLDYAHRVTRKSKAYWAMVGLADKLRSSCKDRINQATDAASLEAATKENAKEYDAALELAKSLQP